MHQGPFVNISQKTQTSSVDNKTQIDKLTQSNQINNWKFTPSCAIQTTHKK